MIYDQLPVNAHRNAHAADGFGFRHQDDGGASESPWTIAW
jgi:hypothetical protein